MIDASGSAGAAAIAAVRLASRAVDMRGSLARVLVASDRFDHLNGPLRSATQPKVLSVDDFNSGWYNSLFARQDLLLR